MGDAPFRLLDVVLDELAQAQARAGGHRSHSAPDVAPNNSLKTKEGATGATQKRLTVCADLNDHDACAWSRNTETISGHAKNLSESVVPVAPPQENCGFARSHIRQPCGSCGSSFSVTPEAEPIDLDGLRKAIAAGVPEEWVSGIESVAERVPPDGISLPEWRALVTGAVNLVRDWGQRLLALGWKTTDLFALHRGRPMDRYESAGLARFVGRCTVVAVTDVSAALRCRTGALKTFVRRSPTTPDWVPIWDLLGGN